jgi:RHS repeat-associated protein
VPISGTLTQVSRGADSLWANTYTGYDRWGNPVVITDALGRATRTQYDATYHLYPVVITDAMTYTTRYDYDWARGLVLTATDANTTSTYYRYDTLGRLATVVRPDDSLTNPTTSYIYSDGPTPWKIETRQRETSGCASCARSTFEFYDGLGRLIQTRSQAEGTAHIVQSAAYDARGLPVTFTLPYSATGSAYIAPTWNSTALSKTVTAYDALGRVTRVTAPDGVTTTRAYSGLLELVLDGNGHQTQSEKDGLGRLIAVREYYGTYAAPAWTPAEMPATTRYWYDARDNLIGVQDALNNVTRMSYDALGRKVAMDDPSMGHWQYQYDAVGNLITQTDALSQSLVFVYDGLNRVIRKSEAGSQSVLAQYEYDKGGNGIGRRTAMTDTTGTARWMYDARGRVLAEAKTITNAGTFTTSLGYDAMDRVVTMTYPTNEAVVTTYSKRGLATGVGGYLTGATYNALGQPVQQSWNNGRLTSYTYWAGNQRLQQLLVLGNPTNLLDLKYGYDKVGNIKAITDTVNSVSQVQSFVYDARDRLTGASTNSVGNGQYNEGYGYDWMGNIITRTVSGTLQTYGYTPRPMLTLPYRMFLPLIMQSEGTTYGSPPPATLHQPFAVITTTAGFSATYDANGNMLTRIENGVTYRQAWNVENRLSVVTNTASGMVTQFHYDGDGQRVKKTEGVTTTVYVGTIYEKNVTTGVTTTYYFAAGQRIATRQGGTLTYLYGDHLGSATVAATSAGAEAGRQRYTPFGTPRGSATLAATDFRFTNQRSEEAALGSLYDYGARFYSPALGRFLSADTVVPSPGNPQALNRYSHAYNNPLKYIDADGHVPIIPILIGVGILALKAVDYGWTAWDSYQSLKVINDPNASQADKDAAAANVAMSAAFEAVEPDDLLPVALPIDDLARKGIIKLGKEAGQATTKRLGREVAQEIVERAVKSEVQPAGKLLARSAANTPVHHLIEKRFADLFGVGADKLPAVVLDKAFHEQEITARLFEKGALPTYPKPPGGYDLQHIWNTYKQVYGHDLGRQDWLDALWPFFADKGVSR